MMTFHWANVDEIKRLETSSDCQYFRVTFLSGSTWTMTERELMDFINVGVHKVEV